MNKSDLNEYLTRILAEEEQKEEKEQTEETSEQNDKAIEVKDVKAHFKNDEEGLKEFIELCANTEKAKELKLDTKVFAYVLGLTEKPEESEDSKDSEENDEEAIKNAMNKIKEKIGDKEINDLTDDQKNALYTTLTINNGVPEKIAKKLINVDESFKDSLAMYLIKEIYE